MLRPVGLQSRIWYDTDYPEEGVLQLSVTDQGNLTLTHGPSPRVLVADELLWGARYNLTHPAITIVRPEKGHGSVNHQYGEHDCIMAPGSECYIDNVLRIETIEQTLIYKVVGYEYDRNGWWASWPD